MMPSPATDPSDQEIEVSRPARWRGVRVNPVATLLAGLLIGAMAGYAGYPRLAPLRPAPPTAPAPAGAPTPATSTPVRMEELIARTRHFRGDEAAPVTMIEFGDFQ
jgi:hypothetical protein